MRLELNRWGCYVAVLRGEKGNRRVSLETKDHAEALAKASQLGLERIEKVASANALTSQLIRKLTSHGSLNVLDAIEMWYGWLQATSESKVTPANSIYCAKAWMRDTGCQNCMVADITEDDLDRWVNKADGCKASTRAYRLSVLRSLFWYLVKKNYVQENIADLINVRYHDLKHDQIEPRPKRVFTDEEYERVLAYLRAKVDTVWNKPVVERSEIETRMLQVHQFWIAATIIGRHSALRLCDIGKLQWASLKTGRLIVHTDKKNTRVDQEITPELQRGLDEILRLDTKWCFPRQATIANGNDRWILSKQFAQILQKACAGKHHFHHLRLTRIVEMRDQGMPKEVIAAFAGHGSNESQSAYTETK